MWAGSGHSHPKLGDGSEGASPGRAAAVTPTLPSTLCAGPPEACLARPSRATRPVSDLQQVMDSHSDGDGTSSPIKRGVPGLLGGLPKTLRGKHRARWGRPSHHADVHPRYGRRDPSRPAADMGPHCPCAPLFTAVLAPGDRPGAGGGAHRAWKPRRGQLTQQPAVQTRGLPELSPRKVWEHGVTPSAHGHGGLPAAVGRPRGRADHASGTRLWAGVWA